MDGTAIVSWLWWAPLGAAALHIGEEFVYPGGFASGGSHRAGVSPAGREAAERWPLPFQKAPGHPFD
jgi:hypothetical protein